MSKVLLIDDEVAILENLKFILNLEGYEVVCATGGREGIDVFQSQGNFDVVLTDMRMPGMDGAEVLQALRKLDPDIGVIILTGHGDMETAVNSMRDGAYDYLNKPVYVDKLLVCVENAIKKRQLIRENKQLQQDLLRQNNYFKTINESAQQILLSMCPLSPPQFSCLKTAAIYKSCDRVGGDMYDIFKLGEKILFYVFDVCGHGILSAVMTMILKSSFDNLKSLYSMAGILPELGKVLEHINIEMLQNSSSAMFATLFVGLYDVKTSEMTYISAGHIDQYLLFKGEVQVLSSTGTVLGLFEDVRFEPVRLQLEPGSRLFLFSDGIIEIWKDEIILSTDRIIEEIRDNKDKILNKTIERIYIDLLSLYRDKKPDDDITLVGMEFLKEGEG